MAKLIVETFGQSGVNVDLNLLELGDSDLMQAQNAVSDPAAGRSSLRKRPGLYRFTNSATAGTVLGGCDLPSQNLNPVGLHYLYIGRGPTV